MGQRDECECSSMVFMETETGGGSTEPRHPRAVRQKCLRMFRMFLGAGCFQMPMVMTRRAVGGEF